jgi:hypothetical protein
MRRQDPLPSVQAHFSYTIRPRMWLAFDSTWYGGVAEEPPRSTVVRQQVGRATVAPAPPYRFRLGRVSP